MDHITLAKERDRMCEAHRSGCSNRCPLFLIAEHCHEQFQISRAPACQIACMANPETAVKIISKWRAENPEPRLPTWREWFLTFLPGVPRDLLIELYGPAITIEIEPLTLRVTVIYGNGAEQECAIDDPIPAVAANLLKIPMITPKGEG